MNRRWWPFPGSPTLLVASLLLLTTGNAVEAASLYGSNSSNLNVPDDGTWVSSSITISGAPSGATVTAIDVHFSAVHSYSADLDVDLNDSGITRNYDLWANEGGSADNPSRTVYGITTFNGLPVNGTWRLFARDTASLDAGYIDEWWIRVYYTEDAQTYAVYGKIDNVVYGSDVDSDGYYETFDFHVCVDADASPGPADVYARLVSESTGQAWWSVNPWTVQGTGVDYHCFAFDETDFSGHLSGNTNLDFTVQIWNSSRSAQLASDASLPGEPIKADRTNQYAVYGVLDNVVYGIDRDSDGYYETFDFEVCIDGDASPGPVTIYARFVSLTTSQAWWSASSWTISGTAVDYHCFAFDENDFADKVTGNTDLDFTVEIWNSAKSVKLATDTSLPNEPIKADYVTGDTEGPKIGTGLGVLGDTKLHIDTYYEERLLLADRYLLEDWTRRAALDPHGHNGNMQSGAKIETRIFDTDWLIDNDKMEDDDNVWNDAGQSSGVDAHVYAARTYDYLWHQLGLNGPDDMGGQMDSLVEVTEYQDGAPCSDQAWASGGSVAFCVSGDHPSFAGALDIVAHEWGHALTNQIGANFEVTAEPGSLDEAFSDWLGAAIMHYYSAGDPWLHGGSVVPGGNRNMADPPALRTAMGDPYPDTYEGSGWWPTDQCGWDSCGRHVNATVADKVFYLLSTGGVHNDIQVSGLGVQSAIQIGLAANRAHWNSWSDFHHAREGMVLAAGAYGDNAVAQVRNAWAAARVGAPAADYFRSAIDLSGSSGQRRSSNREATMEIGEPSHDGKPGGKSIWFTWIAPGDGEASFDTHGSDFDTLLAVYVGTTVGSITRVASNDDDGSANYNSSVSFETTAGTRYRIAVDGYSGDQGTVVLTFAWTEFRTLSNLAIQGPSSVGEGSSATYTATALWDDGTTSSVSPAWSENSPYATISGGGVLTTDSVISDQPLTVHATYTYRGVTKSADKSITILDTEKILTGLLISGPSIVDESSSATYTATALWDDGTASSVSPTWSENSPYASISGSGVLTTTPVTSNRIVVLHATYTYRGVTASADKSVTILDSERILTGLAIFGPSAVDESSSATYAATATWDDGTTGTVSPVWSDDSPYAAIDSSGLLTTSFVTGDEVVTVSATFADRGVTKSASRAVTILDGIPLHLWIEYESLGGSQTREACSSIIAGPSVRIESGSDIVLRAGSSVALADGFSVESGASFRIEISSPPACP